MFRNLLALVFLSSFIVCRGQDARDERHFVQPDYKNIEKVTKDKKLSTYYPNIFTRYVQYDTTLTDHDFTLLYFGYFFQKGFSWAGVTSHYVDSIKKLDAKDDLTIDDKKTMVRYIREVLKQAPYSLEHINLLMNMYHDMGNEDSVNLNLYKMKMIARALFTTGDGLTEATAIHVNSVSDEYSVLHLLGYDFSGTQSLTSNQCDYLEINKNPDNISGFYFDVKELMAMGNKKFGGK